MTGAIPKYGKNFRLSHDFDRSFDRNAETDMVMAGRRYVLKMNDHYYIWSNNNSEKWFVFGPNPRNNWLIGVLGKPHDTLTQAMNYLMGRGS